MRFLRSALAACFVAAAALSLACNSSSTTGMRNFTPGTGPEVQKDLPLKRGNKPMPPDPPDPKAPPLTRG
jgi:hypothetical protein